MAPEKSLALRARLGVFRRGEKLATDVVLRMTGEEIRRMKGLSTKERIEVRQV
jgi:hypothetical protein